MPAAGLCAPGREEQSLWRPAAPGLGGAVSGGGAPGRWAGAAAGGPFLALEVFSCLLESGLRRTSELSELSELAVSRARQVQTQDTSSPAPGTQIFPSLFSGRGWRPGLRGERPRGFCLLSYRALWIRPGFGPAAEGRGAPGRFAMAVESGRRLRSAPRDPAADGGEGPCAIRAVIREAPFQAGGGGPGGRSPVPGGTRLSADCVRPPCGAPRRRASGLRQRAHPTPDVILPLAALPPHPARAGAAPTRPSLPTWVLFLLRWRRCRRPIRLG